MTESLRSGERVSFQDRMNKGFGGKRGPIAPRQGSNKGKTEFTFDAKDYPGTTAGKAAIRLETSESRSPRKHGDITRAAPGKDGQKETSGPRKCNASEHC